MNKLCVGLLLVLAGCSTPLTTMQKGNSVVNCGGGTMGSVLGGRLGYSIQKSNDQDCVNDHTSQGYKIVTPVQ